MKYIAYSLLICSTLFAQDVTRDPNISHRIRPQATTSHKPIPLPLPFNQGDDILPKSAIAGYNTPAGVLLKNSYGANVSDLFFDATFLYYYAKQDGLNLANSGRIVTPAGTSLVSTAISNGTILSQNFEFNPGFKVGFGMNISEWCVAANYTWIRQTTNTSQDAPAPEPTGNGAWITNNWFQQTSTAGQSIAGSALASTWTLGIDLADLSASRPFYQGSNLTAAPFFGIRGAWIRQEINVDLTITPPLSTPEQTVVSTNSSNSWSVGPRTGFDAACLLWKGFRIDSTAAASLLYTQFTHVAHQENDGAIALTQTDLQTLTPELDLSLGLGWGTYLAKQRFHLDLSAGYDFNIFWNQNQIRKNLDEAITGVSPTAGNLYLHGLNITTRFDF